MFIVYVLLALIFLLLPITYTFLRISTNIGPQKENEAFALGLFFWIIGIAGMATMLQHAEKFWGN